MHFWTALQANGTHITTVLADNAHQARQRIRYELNKNPSRRFYLKRWERDGERIQRTDRK